MKKLQLSKEIYSKQSVSNAIVAYSGYARITVSEKRKYLQLTFRNCKYDEVRTIKEFENYLISLENN